jgi:transposase-like protein
MAKCEICKKKLEPNFLGKFKGTIIKDSKGKQHYICPECQKKLKTKEEILKQM